MRRFSKTSIGLAILVGVAAAPADCRAAGWIGATADDGVAYFAYASPAVLERYDMDAGRRLSPLPLAASPRALAVDADGIYVSHGTSVRRMDLDGANDSVIVETTSNVRELVLDGSVLYCFSETGRTRSIATDGSGLIAQRTYFTPMQGASIAPSLHTIFARTYGIAPTGILLLKSNAAGNLGSQERPMRNGAYPDATRTWVLGGDTLVADDSGTVYTRTLEYAGSLGGHVEDLGIHGDSTIVLRGNRLLSYDSNLLLAGRHELSRPARRIFIRGDTVFAFFDRSAGGIDVQRIPLEALLPPEPATTVDPDGLVYEPTSISMGTDGIVYLLSKQHASVFRWSVDDARYLEPMPLTDPPFEMVYSPTTHRLYIAYDGGRVTEIRLDEGTQEKEWKNLPGTPCGLATAGPYLFACEPVGSWNTHAVYDPDARLVDAAEWRSAAEQLVWSQALSRMYYREAEGYPRRLNHQPLAADGSLLPEVRGFDSSAAGAALRVHPLGTRLIQGTGEILDPTTLETIASLPERFDDAIWLDDRLVIGRSLPGATRVRTRDADGNVLATFLLDGSLRRLLPFGRRMVVVTRFQGIPRLVVASSCGRCGERGPGPGDECSAQCNQECLPAGVCGDVDESGDLTVSDALRMLRAAIGLDSEVICPVP